MEILEKILGNSARVKIMRLFLLNRNKGFTNKDVVRRSRVNPDVVRRELRLLSAVGFVKKRDVSWSFNSSFKYTTEKTQNTTSVITSWIIFNCAALN